MNIGQIVSISIAVSLIVSALYFAQRGVRKGIVKAAMTTGNIALSAFLACFLSRDFTTIARDYIYPLFLWIMRLFGVTAIEEALVEVEDIVALVPLFLGVLITPFLFLLFFFVFRTAIGIGLLFVYPSKRKNVDEDGNTVKVKRHVPVWSRICGGVLGALNGILILAVLLVPVSGYANLTVNVGNAYFSEIDTSGYSREGGSASELVYFAMDDYVKPVTNHWFVKSSYVTIGRPMFNHMTETAYGKGEFGLENEAIIGIRLLRSSGKFISSGLTPINEQSVESLREIVDTLKESALMPDLAATFVSSLCDNWAYGRELYGLQKPDFGKTLNPTVDVLWNILATADGEILLEDLSTLIEAMDLLVKSGVFDSLQNSERLMDILSQNSDLITEVVALFESNDHLAPMAVEIKQLCVRAVTQFLNMTDTELTGTLTDSVNAYKNDPEKLSDELKDVVQDYLTDQGIQTSENDGVIDEVVDEVADAISQEFAGKDYVTEQEVIDFVLSYAEGNFTEDEIDNVIPGYAN